VDLRLRSGQPGLQLSKLNQLARHKDQRDGAVLMKSTHLPSPLILMSSGEEPELELISSVARHLLQWPDSLALDKK